MCHCLHGAHCLQRLPARTGLGASLLLCPVICARPDSPRPESLVVSSVSLPRKEHSEHRCKRMLAFQSCTILFDIRTFSSRCIPIHNGRQPKRNIEQKRIILESRSRTIKVKLLSTQGDNRKCQYSPERPTAVAVTCGLKAGASMY